MHRRSWRLTALLAAFAFLSFARVGFAQAPDSCLVLLPPGDFFNPDSVKVYTCPDPEDEVLLYARGWFDVVFNEDAIDVPAVSEDSILEITWREIDERYATTRDGLREVENRFGPFVLSNVLPDETDPVRLSARHYVARFERYVNVAIASRELDSLEGVRCSYLNRVRVLNVDVSDGDNAVSISLTPNPCGDYVTFENGGISPTGPVEILDLFGNVVATAPARLNGATRIATHHLPAGRYFVLVGGRSIPLIIRR